jgi:Carboxypeptidase regulatory-like domain
MQSFRITLLLLIMFSSLIAQTQPTPDARTGIEGVITVSPVHGGPTRLGVSNSRPLANTVFIIENEKGSVRSFTTDNQGQFRVSLPPGHYTVAIKERKSKIGRYGPFDVDVVAGQMTKVEWQCDTGMR